VSPRPMYASCVTEPAPRVVAVWHAGVPPAGPARQSHQTSAVVSAPAVVTAGAVLPRSTELVREPGPARYTAPPLTPPVPAAAELSSNREPVIVAATGCSTRTASPLAAEGPLAALEVKREASIATFPAPSAAIAPPPAIPEAPC